MEKEISVTISLKPDGSVRFEFYENESGDFFSVCTTLDSMQEEECRVGTELMSWVSLMADEMEEGDGF